ncbi:hypothetical protein [Nannocystis pusilla]|uniref:hypothetical protein n=1 Tax=Nannocystis pusilla TaxID=889268 RepID=UPI003B80D02F
MAKFSIAERLSTGTIHRSGSMMPLVTSDCGDVSTSVSSKFLASRVGNLSGE